VLAGVAKKEDAVKKIILLGATGSIGVQALEVIAGLNAEAPGTFRVTGLSAHRNIALLRQQVAAFGPEAVAVAEEAQALALGKLLGRQGPEILAGPAGVAQLAGQGDGDLVLNAIVGVAGLAPTLAALRRGRAVALANKETLVAAGELVMGLGGTLYPVDSEHSAIWQCLLGNQGDPVEKIYLTASGGPFRSHSKAELAGVTAAQALRHPNWAMGPKITVDSATMMNKGLEVIEAKWLFGLESAQIEVLVHPQSLVHSMVAFEDGMVLAQLGPPDMRGPIQFALTYPGRRPNRYPRLNFVGQTLTFEAPDPDRFPCLALARAALEAGGALPAVMNAANEVAVARFLNEEISFARIPELLSRVMDAYSNNGGPLGEEAVYAADAWARETAGRVTL
jgi:1-deoxy-D-xylulose-5-phosphate reductoisomerase